MKPTLVYCSLLISPTLLAAEVKPLAKLDKLELEVRLQADARVVQVQRDGLQKVIAFLDSRPDLFPKSPSKDSPLLRREEKEVVWKTWQQFLDYNVGLDSIERYHASFQKLKGAAREQSFVIGYASMLGQYRSALEFIDRVERNPEWDKVLNDPVPELGLPGGMYAKLKFRFLNLGIASEFAAREIVMKTFSGDQLPQLREGIRADAQYIWKADKGKGEVLTAKNALKVIQNGATSAWLPVQTGVSEWMGDTKVYRSGRSLISPRQVEQLKEILQPGDVLLERREWYVSNVGLPGFWSHAALYVGTAGDRRSFFADADSRAWVKQQGEPSGDLELLLQSRYPTAYQQSETPQEHGHVVRVIEAISEGVSLTTLEHSADCDSLAILRPRLPKSEKAQAILRALHYTGRPYDFNFDFATDAQLVCTELVYKSYEPANGFAGLKFPLTEMLGRKLLPANEIARLFDTQEGTADQQLDLVIFLDGQERKRNAVEGSLTEFRSSWQRPKWHVLVQK
ncbi:MAG TPA: YiiX/YebB-like N1pC/P60 family cysteine hydrolase [Verrucomicrobiae bacterium]|nr:YiiX/YebB-like N1pC/P60 family cysteine hydrolase [Verrucomicrobiae bacterium]